MFGSPRAFIPFFFLHTCDRRTFLILSVCRMCVSHEPSILASSQRVSLAQWLQHLTNVSVRDSGIFLSLVHKD